MRPSTIDVADEPLPVTLWLSVSSERRDWVFELGPDEARAIVVGSLQRAHIRLDHRGIAPVHFHFERDGASVHLVPAYGRELFANCARVAGPLELGQRTILEFSGIRLKVLVSDAKPSHAERVSPAWPVQCTRRSFLPEFPDSPSSIRFHDHLTHALSASLLNTVSFEARTRSVRDGPGVTDRRKATTARTTVSRAATGELAAHPSMWLTLDDLGGTKTRDYEPYDPARDLPLVRAQSASSNTIAAETVRESKPLTPRAIIPVSGPPATTLRPAVSADSPGSGEAEACLFHTQDEILLPTVTKARSGVEWVERLGILAKRRPILVTATALVGSLLLTLAILALSKIAAALFHS